MEPVFSEPLPFEHLRRELVRDCQLLIAKRRLLARKFQHLPLDVRRRASEIAAVQHRLGVRFAQLSVLASAQTRFTAKFDPSQPRVPAGQREGGQWVSTGRAVDPTAPFGSETSSRQVSVTNRSPANSGGRSPILAGLPMTGGPRLSPTIDYSTALTGISSIDNVTKALSEMLSKSMQDVGFIPESAAAVYGTAVHADFGVRVRLEGIPGVEVEQSFFNNDQRAYGYPGSVRTDVILRNDLGDIIAIYDVKTGRAELSLSRLKELRDHTGVGPGVPVIQLQVNRGATIKGSAIFRQSVSSVIAELWNPLHRDIAGLAGVA